MISNVESQNIKFPNLHNQKKYIFIAFSIIFVISIIFFAVTYNYSPNEFRWSFLGLSVITGTGSCFSAGQLQGIKSALKSSSSYKKDEKAVVSFENEKDSSERNALSFEKEDPEELLKMARMYITGIMDCYEKRNIEKGFKLYEELVDKGNVRAMTELALHYKHGMWREKNHKKCFELYQEAVKKGDPAARCYIAQCYQEGIGVPQSVETGFKLLLNMYQEPQYQNYPLVIESLARCYEYGMGTIRDFDRALILYNKAHDLGSSTARFGIESIQRQKHWIAIGIKI